MVTETYQDIPLKLAPLLSAFSHPARIQIILHLAKYKGCPAGSISDKLPLAKSTVSEHLSRLREAGLIKSHADGNCIYYSLDDERFEFVKEQFTNFFDAIGQSQDDRKNCQSFVNGDTAKCNRVYEICKTLPCFTDNCYPDHSIASL